MDARGLVACETPDPWTRADAAARGGLAWQASRSPDGLGRSFGLFVMAALIASPNVWPHHLVLVFVAIALRSPVLSPIWFVPMLAYLAPTQPFELAAYRGRMQPREHAPANAMHDAGEIERFHDRCSDLMRELLDGLAAAPDRPRPFGEIEDAIGWPRRRIASVLGGVSRLRHTEFEGRRPYRFHDARDSASGRWEMWVDSSQASAVRAASCWSGTPRG